MTSSMILGSFRSLFLNFQIFAYFPHIFSLFMSSLILLWLEHTSHAFNSSYFVEVCFMVWNMVRLSECAIGTWNKCVFFCNWVLCSLSGQVNSQNCSCLLHPYEVLCNSFNQQEKSVEVPATILDWSISSLHSVTFCFIYFVCSFLEGLGL